MTAESVLVDARGNAYEKPPELSINISPIKEFEKKNPVRICYTFNCRVDDELNTYEVAEDDKDQLVKARAQMIKKLKDMGKTVTQS